MPESGWRAAPVLGVRDVHQATTYFVETLGFSCPGGVFEGVVPGEGGVYSIVRREEIEVHLQIRRREVFAHRREAIEGDAYFFVPDADILFDELQGRGAVFHRTIEDSPYGLRDFVVETPDGHRLTFGSPSTIG